MGLLCGPSRKTVFLLLVLGISLLLALQVENVYRCRSFVPPDESATYLPPGDPGHAEQHFESSSPLRGNLTTLSSPLVVAATQPANQVEAAVPPTDDKSSTVNVLELSKTYQDERSNITAAVCFKTLFGDIDLGIVLQWVAYNRLMGFDHVFMFYRPEMTSNPRFAELASLPYVTLTENTEGKRQGDYNQWKTEIMCLSEKRFAADYDWAMLADIDEFLWFPERHGIKPFLAQQQARNLTYLSFGKQMYTMNHRVDFAAQEYEIGVDDLTIDTIDLINKVYAKDFEIGGYKMVVHS
jgi:hypothetical protein